MEQQAALEVQLSDDFNSNSIEEVLEAEEVPPRTGGDMDATLSDQQRHFESSTPARLRIRSLPLIIHLRKIPGGSLPVFKLSETEGKKLYSSVTFLRPFKFFIRHDTAIRKSLGDIKSLVKKEDESSQDENQLNASKREERGFDNRDLLEDLKLLINFFDTDLKATFDLRKKIKDGTAVDIEYADLWHLFCRGEVIVSRGNKDHAFMVASVAGGRDKSSSKKDKAEKEEEKEVSFAKSFTIDCFSMGTDGSSYVPELATFAIREFHGSRPILSLPVYPLRLDPEAKDLRTKFVSRGRKLMEVTRDSFCHTSVRGKTLDEPSYEVDGQAIVDITLALNARPDWRTKEPISIDQLTRTHKYETYEPPWCKMESEGCCGGDIVSKDWKLDDLLTEEFFKSNGGMVGPLGKDDVTNEDALMLMRPYVRAFILRSRTWATVRVEDLREVVFENRLDDLVLPKSHKPTVKALVRTHENTQTLRANPTDKPGIGRSLDSVKGKGAGLIILLHGPPGVGKTSTAECVADETKRPLFPITCGDLGETAAEVETRLQYNFQLAQKWGCVLLLDESDIFLSKRNNHDLHHNAVTSVFLRSLEYYSGILFLTTNRVGIIDPAFKSRIQMSLFYPHLDRAVTIELYKKFIERAKAEQARSNSYLFKIKRSELIQFAKENFRYLRKKNRDPWNGRQIRNAFQTAITLAEYESMNKAKEDPITILGKAQFEIVAEGYEKFDEYLITTLGSSEGEMAKRENWRDDEYSYTLDASSARTAGAVSSPPKKSTPGHKSQKRSSKGSRGLKSRRYDSSTSEDDGEEDGSDEDGSDEDDSSDKDSDDE
ncbi:hypothetical protein ACO1O0_007749 [Amphichorda felina]